MKIKKVISTVILAAVFTGAFTISGCAGKEKVEFTVWGSKEANELMEDIAASFTELYKDEADITIHLGIEAEDTAGDSIALNPSKAADVFTIPDDQLLRLHGLDTLMPLDPQNKEIIEDSGGEDSSAIQCAKIDGQLYGLPLTAGNGYFMFYNASYFTDEDVKTLDGMLNAADTAGKAISMDWSSGWYTYAFFGGAGLTLKMSEDGTRNVCNWNAADTEITGVDVAEAMLKISKHPCFKNCINDDFKEGVKDGSIIAGVNGTWNTKWVKECWGDDMRAVKLPTYTVAGQQAQMTSFIGYKLVCVNSFSPQKEWSQRFAEYMVSYENQMKRFNATGELPANVKAQESPEVKASPDAGALAEQSKFAIQQRIASPFWNPMTEFGTIMAAGNKDNMDLQELLDNVVSQITSPE